MSPQASLEEAAKGRCDDRREGDIKMEADSGVVWLAAREC